MSGQPPLWLATALVEALEEVGATASIEDLEAEAEYVLAQWDQDGRIILNSRYLGLLFERLDELEGPTPSPGRLRVAASYFGVSNDPLVTFLGKKFGRRVDFGTGVESRLLGLGVTPEESRRIVELIALLASPKLPTEDLDAQILLDSSLAVLAVSPQAYAKLCKGLRTYSALDDNQFLRARREHIKQVLSRSRLFLTPFAAHWSDAVRENLEGELSQINSRLAAQADSDNDLEEAVRRSSVGSTGPIVIRSSRVQKQMHLHDEAPAPKRVIPAAPEPRSSTPTAARDLDETSTLEAFDDLFSHRKAKRD